MRVPARVPSLTAVIAMVVLWGCGSDGGRSEGQETGGAEGSADLGPDRRDDAASDPERDAESRADLGALPGAERLELPMVPVLSATLAGSAVAVVVEAPAPSLLLEDSLTMALGGDYPTEHTGLLGEMYWANCGPLPGVFELLDVTGGGEVVSAELVEGGVHFAMLGEGAADVRIAGKYTPTGMEQCGDPIASLATVPFEMRVHVRGVRPAGLRVRRPFGCAEAPAPVRVATSSVAELWVDVLDADGEWLNLANAQRDRSVALTIMAEPGAALSAPADGAGLQALQFPSVAGPVVVTPALGEPLTIEVVDAPTVTGVDVKFYLVGFGGGDVELTSGETYGPGWGRVANRIAPAVSTAWVGPEALCTQPNPEWFTLVSDTPEHCDIRPVAAGSIEDFDIFRPTLGATAYVHADGECTLRLGAVELDGGAGFEARFSAELLGVDGMHDIP